MRYITLKSNGLWQFRYQIPSKYRKHFNNQFEFKRSFTSPSKNMAYLKSLEYELAIKNYMSEVEINGTTASFESTIIQDLINKSAIESKSRILAFIDKLNSDPILYQALKLARQNQDDSGEEVEGLFTLNLTVSGALSQLNDIYPNNDSARIKAEAMFSGMTFKNGASSTSMYDSFFQQLVSVYQQLIKARLAIEALDIDHAKEIAHDLTELSKNCGIAKVTPFNSSKQNPTHSKEPITKNPVYFDKIVAMYEQEKVNEQVQKYNVDPTNRKNSVFKQLNSTLERCRIVHAIIGKMDMLKITRNDANLAMMQLFLFPKDPIKGRNKNYFINHKKEDWIDINNDVNHPVISKDTAAKYIQQTSQVYRWAIQHNYLTYNPFSGIAKKEQCDEREKRNPFSDNDLSMIFAKDEFTHHNFGVNPITKSQLDYKFWVPLTCLLSGMRPNEAAQLKIKNVKKLEDIWCFEITDKDPDQSLKTPMARRTIPIHKKLIELGILQLLQNRTENQMLFKDLTFTDSDRYFGKVSSWFIRYITLPMSFSNQKKSFYSFRHTSINHFTQSGQISPVLLDIVGHKGELLVCTTYSTKSKIKKMKTFMDNYNVDKLLEHVKGF